MFEEINKLSTEELAKFKLFVQSPYINNYKTIIKLFNYLESVYPYITKDNSGYQKISIKVYNQKKANEIKIRKLISDFNKIFKRFLIDLMLEKENSLKELLLLRAYREKQFKRKYYVLSEKISKSYDRKFVTDENSYSNSSRIEEENFYYFHDINDFRLIYAFKKKTEELDLYIVYKKLRNFFDEVVSEVYMSNKLKVENNFYDMIVDFVERNLTEIKKSHPYIYLYFLVVRFFENYDLKYLNLLTDYYAQIKSKLTIKLHLEFLQAIKNLYLKTFTKGIRRDKEFANEIFRLCDSIYMDPSSSYRRFYKNSNMKSYEFMAIVNLAIKVERMDWTEAFIEKYGKNLNDELSEDCYNISLSDYHYAVKNFEKSIMFSNNVSNKVANFFLTSKVRMLQCLCELNDEAGIYISFENLKQYQKRNTRINEYDIQLLKNYVSIFSDYIQVREAAQDKLLAVDLASRLLKKIESCNGILLCRNWFIKKLKVI